MQVFDIALETFDLTIAAGELSKAAQALEMMQSERDRLWRASFGDDAAKIAEYARRRDLCSRAGRDFNHATQA